MEFQNAYNVLGLRKGANEAAIKDAYARLVRKYDPEKHTDHFMVIQKSYEALRDPVRRAQVDALTFNYTKGQFLFSSDEQTNEPDAQVSQRLRELEQRRPEGEENGEWRASYVKSLMMRSFKKVSKRLWAEAIEDWRSILTIDPTHQRAKNNLLYSFITLGYSYADHDLFNEAIELWEQALKMNPDDEKMLHNLAIAYEMAGRKEQASRYWQEALRRWQERLERNPDDAYLRQSIIEVRRHHGHTSAVGGRDTAASIEEYREILKINPNDFEAQYKIATALMEEQKWGEATQSLQKLVKQFPKNIEVLNLLGSALLSSGHIEQAFLTWKRSLATDPKNYATRESIIRARMSLGKVFRGKGMYTQSLVNFKALLRFMKSPEIYMEIGQTYMAKGDKRSAAAAFETVMKMDPKNREARQFMSDMRLRG